MRSPLADAGPAILLLLAGGLLTAAAEALDINGGKLIALALTFAATASLVLLLDGRRREARARAAVASADARAATAQAEARRLDDMLRAIGEATPDLIFIKDRDSRIHYANPAMQKITGRIDPAAPPREEWAPVPAEVLGHIENDQIVMESRRPMVFLEPFTDAKGVTRVYRASKVPVMRPNGELWGVGGFASDVTVDQASREALEKSERDIRTLADALPHLVLGSRADGRGLYANKATYRYLGLSLNEGRRNRQFWLNYVHPADIDVCRWEVQNALKDRRSVRTRVRVRRHDGVWRWLLLTVTPIRNSKGELVNWIVTGTDIQDLIDTEMQREAAARELAGQKAFLDTVLETAPVALVVADDLGMIHSFTRQAEELFGWSEEEVLGRSLELLMPPDHRVGHGEKFKSVSLDHERRVIGTERRVMGMRRDGTTFPMELHLGDFMDGGRRFFTGFVRDLTEREQREEHLQDLRSQIVDMAGVMAMGELASAIIHEVAQPMAACSYYLAALETPEAAQRLTSEQQDAALAGAANEARRAQEIIRRLRGLVQNGQAEKAPADVETAIREGTTVATIGVNSVPVELDLGPDLGVAQMDKVQINQVLVNLIRNAYQALAETEKPHLTIRARREGERIIVSVSDNGPGVSDEVRERLFEPFSSTRVGGMGIGLSVSRTIVEAHGGRIWCEPSTPGGGATFSFSIGTTA